MKLRFSRYAMFGNSLIFIGATNFSSNVNTPKTESQYVLLSILEDVNLSATDRKDYYLRKGEIVHVPGDSAKI